MLGVNGAGKTTAIKLLTGLSKPTAGDIYIGGLNLKENAHQVKCMIGVSAQESAIAPNLTVYENLAFMCNIYGFSSSKTKAKIEEVTAQMDLAAVLYRKAGQLSGGWKRRVSIAMAIISEPEILFLDEPTLGLDILARRALWDLLHSLRTKITVVMTTHYMEEAERLSNRIGILRNGKLLAVGSANELMQSVGAVDFETAFVSIVEGDNK